jgi:membrane-associated phospholipid phosphatase
VDPPGAGGNYPSGGCARVVLGYGLVVWFCLRERRKPSRPLAVLLYGLVLAAGVLEAYSRTYLLKHWVTDTVGGLVYGGVLLVGAVAVATLLDRPGRLLGAAPPDAGAPDVRAARQPATATTSA